MIENYNKGAQDELQRALIDITYSDSLVSRNVSCSNCGARISVRPWGDQDTDFEVWEINGEVKILCSDCEYLTHCQLTQSKCDKLDYVKYNLGEEASPAWVCEDISNALRQRYDQLREYSDALTFEPMLEIEPEAATRVKHFGAMKVLLATR